ncbi:MULTISPECIES: hypothetical protein [Bacilli]|jgi:hypothetical protein|uniref:Uncharacterized protein n=6 Tax=root TaxID=1 RepID=A0A8S5UIF7_9CAUD|nr:hypothetical protein [Enterococcus faecalis]ELG7156244.1 hypothetical protein [Staphylococcus aureus]DAF94050.1 MAG TPA: hypothetical protein [Myoviridae sp. ctu2j3]ELL1201635.1 hypothetical protein [Staphylococcus aureus]MDN3098590.1 hypothetical protein [Enterococcus faecalis]DAF94255.1 MAG TPA: hypothetical protein [Myoviridae sp. ctu2j3]
MNLHDELSLDLIRGAAKFRGYLYRDHVVRDAVAVQIFDGRDYRYYNPLDITNPDFWDFVNACTGLTLAVKNSGVDITYVEYPDKAGKRCSVLKTAVSDTLGRVIVKLVLDE